MEIDSMTQTELASYLETLARLVEATGREGKKMENIIREVMCAMEHGIRRDEAINDAANIHAASYDA